MTVHVLEALHEHAEAAAAAAVARDLQQQQQLQVVPRQPSRPAAAAAAAATDEDPLAFLEDLPLYGQQDHAHMAAALLDGSNSSGKQQRRLQLLDTLQLSLRAVYLMLVFAPFLLLGVPMLLLSWYLLTRAAAAQQQGSTDQQQRGTKQLATSRSNSEGVDVTVISPLPLDNSSSSACHDSSRTSWLSSVTGSFAAAKDAVSQPRMLLAALLRQLLSLLTQIAALLDLLLVLLLGGHWAAGIGAWESAGLWLRVRAWRLLLFSSSAAGAAFIKWGQWSSARRDIFPEDFCDTLASLHDKWVAWDWSKHGEGGLARLLWLFSSCSSWQGSGESMRLLWLFSSCSSWQGSGESMLPSRALLSIALLHGNVVVIGQRQ
jgi:hypothetical protein